MTRPRATRPGATILLCCSLAVLLAGCFGPSKPNCAFRCGAAGECPADYMCGGDGRCHLVTGGGLAVCQDQLADAAVDARVVDGGPDAPMIDGAPDAPMIDGAADAPMVDAEPADAAPPDAMPADAPPAAALAVSPMTGPFGTAATGTQTAYTTFTITNIGGSDSGALTTMPGGADAGDFEIGTNTCAAALAASMSCAVDVRFRPLSVGGKSATLTVSATPGGMAVAALTGLGAAPASLSVNQPTYAFGSVMVGTSSADATFTFSNTGGVPTGSLATTMPGADPADFVIVTDNCNGAPLPATSTCDIVLHFTPSSAAPKSATLTVTGAPGGSAASMLDGTGTP